MMVLGVEVECGLYVRTFLLSRSFTEEYIHTHTPTTTARGRRVFFVSFPPSVFFPFQHYHLEPFSFVFLGGFCLYGVIFALYYIPELWFGVWWTTGRGGNLDVSRDGRRIMVLRVRRGRRADRRGGEGVVDRTGLVIIQDFLVLLFSFSFFITLRASIIPHFRGA